MSNGIELQYRMFSVVFNVRRSRRGYSMLTTSIPLKVDGAPESLPSPLPTTLRRGWRCRLRASPPQPRRASPRESHRCRVGTDPNVPVGLPRLSCSHSPKAKKKKEKKKKGKGKAPAEAGSIRRVLNESAPVSSRASPTVLAVKYISD